MGDFQACPVLGITPSVPHRKGPLGGEKGEGRAELRGSRGLCSNRDFRPTCPMTWKPPTPL